MDPSHADPFDPSRRLPGKWLPLLVVALCAWLVARGTRRVAWTVFGLYWVLHWSGAIGHR
jgi:hypothetical protein